jgi:hypothetical protein
MLLFILPKIKIKLVRPHHKTVWLHALSCYNTHVMFFSGYLTFSLDDQVASVTFNLANN